MRKSTHYKQTMQAFGEIAKAPEKSGLVEGVDFFDMDKLEAKALNPNLAHHYICELEKQLEDGRKIYIDIHHLRNVGITKIFPTIVRMLEISPEEKQVDFSPEEKQVDIYSIDNNGNCLVHTNKSYPNGKEVETRDTSLERLMPYEEDILEAPSLCAWARLRLGMAFYKYKHKSE